MGFMAHVVLILLRQSVFSARLIAYPVSRSIAKSVWQSVLTDNFSIRDYIYAALVFPRKRRQHLAQAIFYTHPNQTQNYLTSE